MFVGFVVLGGCGFDGEKYRSDALSGRCFGAVGRRERVVEGRRLHGRADASRQQLRDGAGLYLLGLLVMVPEVRMCFMRRPLFRWEEKKLSWYPNLGCQITW